MAKKNKIKIKPENKGKFTDYCGGKVTNECIQRGLNSPNPTTRKRANFARNSRKWNKKAFGGYVNPLQNDYFIGGLLSGGLGLVSGITGAIKQKRQRDEAERLYEERKIEAERMQKQAALNRMPAPSEGVVPGVANPYMLALGGLSTSAVNPSNYITEFNTGGTHAQNPRGGIQIGTGANGKPNTVEEGEVAFDFEDGKYIFSNRLII